MNKIERAVILAAGYGTRLKPLTDHTPKPLLEIKGLRLIESALNALFKNSITEVYVVVGYKKEAFLGLPHEFPGVSLIENPDYAEANNISSLYAAREHLCNALIMDADQLVLNPGVFERDFERSGYLAVRNYGPTHEWTLDVEDGIIVGCTRGGGCEGFRLLSVSLWSGDDGSRLAEDIAHIYKTCGIRDVYWDDVPLFLRAEHYRLGIREVSAGDIIEIDTLKELAALDNNYADITNSITLSDS
jgi:CTP:phosphocholine cytidylyltransferase-like protein